MTRRELIAEEIIRACDELSVNLILKLSALIDDKEEGELLYPKQLMKLEGLHKTAPDGSTKQMHKSEFLAYRRAGHFPAPDVGRGRHSRWLMSTYQAWLDDRTRMSVDEFLSYRKKKTRS